MDIASIPTEVDVEPSVTDRAIAEDPRHREVIDALVSEWIFQDITSPFSVNLFHADGLVTALDSIKDFDYKDDDLNVFVSMGLYFGETPLEPLRLSAASPIR